MACLMEPNQMLLCAVVCCAGRDGSWLSLGDHPHIPDDSELLGLFEDVEGITFLAQPGASDAANFAGPEPHDRPSRYIHTTTTLPPSALTAGHSWTLLVALLSLLGSACVRFSQIDLPVVA
jgi:hypothetical protein